MLRAAKAMQRGYLLAHQTGTVAGVAALPHQPLAVRRLQAFKQRQAPFLLLADSISTALAQARYLTPALRRMARASWPGAVTLVFPARPGLPEACYQRGMMAVRVDADVSCRKLAKACGGLLLSSSLNRKSCVTMPVKRMLRTHYARYGMVTMLPEFLPQQAQASKIYRVSGRRVQRLR